MTIDSVFTCNEIELKHFLQEFEKDKRRKYIIAVDFDGTLVEDEFPSIGKVKQKVLDRVKLLQSLGCCFILWTSRNGQILLNAVFWCINNGIVPDKINDHSDHFKQLYNADITKNPKIFADEYLDDRSINVNQIK